MPSARPSRVAERDLRDFKIPEGIKLSKQLYQPRNPVLKCELLYVPGRGKAVQAGEQAEEIFVKAVIDRLGRKGGAYLQRFPAGA